MACCRTYRPFLIGRGRANMRASTSFYSTARSSLAEAPIDASRLHTPLMAFSPRARAEMLMMAAAAVGRRAAGLSPTCRQAKCAPPPPAERQPARRFRTLRRLALWSLQLASRRDARVDDAFRHARPRKMPFNFRRYHKSVAVSLFTRNISSL